MCCSLSFCESTRSLRLLVRLTPLILVNGSQLRFRHVACVRAPCLSSHKWSPCLQRLFKACRSSVWLADSGQLPPTRLMGRQENEGIRILFRVKRAVCYVLTSKRLLWSEYFCTVLEKPWQGPDCRVCEIQLRQQWKSRIWSAPRASHDPRTPGIQSVGLAYV